MARITQKYLEAMLVRVSKMGGWPIGSYPTTGQLILERGSTGRYQACCLVRSTVQTEISRCLTASEMEEFLSGMIAAYDAPRFRAHWRLPSVEAEA